MPPGPSERPAWGPLDGPSLELTRRRLLQLLGCSAGSLYGYWAWPWRRSPQALALAPPRLPAANPPTTAPVTLPQPPAPQLSLVAPAYRRDDMLVLVFYGYNLVLTSAGSQATPTRATSTEEAYLVVGFPPQAVLEAAVPVGATPPPFFPDPPLPASLSGPSQLAFLVPSTVGPIPFTLEALLDWSQLTPLWEASPFAGPQPPALATYIEAPWHLLLSPGASATWSHASAPLTYSGRTELWQTRLGEAGVEPPASSPELRAVWAPGYPEGVPEPFGPSYQTSLTNGDRLDIIALTCGTSGGTTGIARPAPLPSVPARAELLMLSALGASLNVHGAWGQEGTSSLTDWAHRMVTGRESYVRTVRAGFLFPFGHRAAHIVVTDRELQVDSSGVTIAYLVQRQYVVVVQPSLDYGAAGGEPWAGRQNPLRQLAVTTIATPPLDPMSADAQVGSFPAQSGDDEVFWVRVNGSDYPFAFVATDREGRVAQFHTGAIFVSRTVALSGYNGQAPAQVAQAVAAAYADPAQASRRSPDLAGQLVAFADPGGQPGSTAHHVSSLELAGAPPAGQPGPAGPPFFPFAASARLRLPGAEQLAGTSLGGIAFTISPNYYQDNFKAGVAEIYLELAAGAPITPLGFSPRSSGGLATPNFGITGLARDLGPVAGPVNDLLAGKFNPQDFFATVAGALEAKLLGAISLAEVLAGSGTPGATTASQAPRIQTVVLYPGNDTTQPPEALQTTLDWSPVVKADSLGLFAPKEGSALTVHAVVYSPLNSPQQTTYKVHGELTNFDLVLFGTNNAFIDIAFKGLSFDFATGAKVQVRPEVSGVSFQGPLSFVQAFESLFASLGGPSVSVTSAGVQASYSVALPDLSVGVFSLSNLKLAGVLNVPFDSSPVRLRVGFCTRENPFLLAIDLFTGGGFFGLAVGGDGIEMLEASLEFGASAALDLGVATGGVSMMAGIYFALQTTPSRSVQLTGFLRADSNLSVLGVVSLSVEFYMGLTYLDPGQAYGTATVTVEVSVLCFSKSVSMTMQKTIGGSDPTFAQAMTQADWSSYCLAFAPQ